jgi:hypothetical protein
MVFGRELRLPCDLLFEAPPEKEEPTSDYVAGPVGRVHDIHHYARRYLKGTRDRMKARYGCLHNSAFIAEQDQIWLCCRTSTRRKSLKLQPT